MKRPEVSIIVPCFNQGQYLEQCLGSVLCQTHFDWECIIVNDGSTDNTEDIVKQWINKDARFVYLKIQNSGLSNARNAGIEKANGEYILPLDADDYISNNYLSACLNKIKSDPSIKVVYGKAFKVGIESGEWSLDTYSFEKLLLYNMIFCTALYRKEDWKNIGGYDPNMKYGFEDWEFWINLLKKGGNAIQIYDCTFYYRVKEVSMVKNLIRNDALMKSSREYIIKKHLKFYTNKNRFELYLMVKEWESKFANLEIHLSEIEIIKIFFKRLKFIFLKP